MKLPPASVIERDVLAMVGVRVGVDKVAREVEVEATGLAYQRAYDSGSYAADIRVEPAAGPGLRVVAESRVSLWIEEGTGIHGPLRVPITPKRGKFLVFRLTEGAPLAAMGGTRHVGDLVFAKSVKGREASWVMRDAARMVASRYGLVFTNHRAWQG